MNSAQAEAAPVPPAVVAAFGFMQASARVVVCFPNSAYPLAVPVSSLAEAKRCALRYAKVQYGARWFVAGPLEETAVLELHFEWQGAGRYSREWQPKTVR